jgi:L-2-hydroxyglutarate oxidase LhgO
MLEIIRSDETNNVRCYRIQAKFMGIIWKALDVKRTGISGKKRTYLKGNINKHATNSKNNNPYREINELALATNPEVT